MREWLRERQGETETETAKTIQTERDQQTMSLSLPSALLCVHCVYTHIVVYMLLSHPIYPLTARVIGAPQMIS